MKTFVGTIIAGIVGLAILLTSPVRAQFADQATLLTNAGGSLNAYTATLPNASSYGSIVGVLLKYIPTFANSGDATLQLNSFGTALHFRKPTGSGIGALTGTELQAGQPVLLMVDPTATYFLVMSNVALPINAGNLTSSTIGFNVPANLQINASVASNQLTISLVANNGAAATAANPITIAFRDPTIANGDPVIVQIVGPLSFTISSGNTVGCVNAVTCRLRLYVINNAGTIALCAYNSLSYPGSAGASASIIGINEASLQTSASGTSGGSSPQTLYCSTSAVSSKAVLGVGYLDVTESVAGIWASVPTVVQLFGPGIPRAGSTLSSVYCATSSCSISPTSNANLVKVSVSGSFEPQTTNNVVFSLKRASTVIATLVAGGPVENLASMAITFAGILDAPSTVSPTTYSLTANSGSGSATNFELEEISP